MASTTAAAVEKGSSPAELHAPTPVLEQALRHLDRRDAQRTDELVVAFYRELTAGSAV